MRKKSIPGQRSNFALLVSSIWTILGLFIIIIGHLVIAFFIYGQLKQADAINELSAFLPFLETQHLYAIAVFAIIIDIWVMVSHKKAYEKQFKR